MYIKNGIIDRFSASNFVDNITIPYYQKNADYFDFVLRADVISWNGQEQAGKQNSKSDNTGTGS